MKRLSPSPTLSDFVKQVPGIVDQWLHQVTLRFGVIRQSTTPGTQEIPNNQWGIFKNTTTGDLTLSLNDDGTVKSTLLTTGGGGGDVLGPASAVDNRVVFFDGTTGKRIKDSGLTLSGTNTGDQTSIVGITGTLAEFNTALTDADFATGGGTATGTNTGDQTITLTGDVTGSGTGSFATTLKNTGTAGTYVTVTTDAKGRVTSGTTTQAWSSITGTPTTLSGYGITDAQPLDGDLTAIAALAGTSGLLKKTGANTWSLDTSAYITGNQTITFSGDAAGSGTTAVTLTLATVNASPQTDTFRKITVNGKGLVTATTAVSSSDMSTAHGSQTANRFYAAPNGSAGTPSFRAIVAADIPTLNQNTTGTASNVTGTVAVANGGTGGTTQATARTGLGLGTIATQDSSNVTITGGTALGLTSLAVGASSTQPVTQGRPTNIASHSTGGPAGYSATRWSNDTIGPQVFLQKSRGTSVGTLGIISSGDILGYLTWAGDDGTDLVTQAAEIAAEVDGATSSNVIPGRIVFRTATTGGTLTDALTIDASQTASFTGNVKTTASVLASGSSSGVGYTTGAGGTETQLVDKTTAVTLNKPTGQITLAASALAAGAIARFTLNNSTIAAGDIVVAHRITGGTGGAYNCWCDFTNAGSCIINVKNESAGSLSQSPVIGFIVLKSTTS